MLSKRRLAARRISLARTFERFAPVLIRGRQAVGFRRNPGRGGGGVDRTAATPPNPPYLSPMKLIVFLILGYFSYRLFIKPLLIDGGYKKQEPLPRQEPEEEDFTDYEEID